MPFQLGDYLPLNRGGTPGNGASGDYHAETAAEFLNGLDPLFFPLGGDFLLDPNEVNGWGVIGPYDQRNSQDLGDVTDLNAGTLSSNNIGGLMFPYDVKLTEVNIIHDNSNAAAQAWGWVILTSTFTFDSNTEVTTAYWNEVSSGTGPRNYGDNVKQNTVVTEAANDSGAAVLPGTTIPARTMITLAVAAPTAAGTNYYVRINAGFLKFDRV